MKVKVRPLDKENCNGERFGIRLASDNCTVMWRLNVLCSRVSPIKLTDWIQSVIHKRQLTTARGRARLPVQVILKGKNGSES